MFGFQEILIVTAVVLGILFLPRIMNRPPARPARLPGRAGFRISAGMRIAVVLSLIYPALAAAYCQPWHRDPIWFYYAGAGPVVIGWLLFWILAGFKKR